MHHYAWHWALFSCLDPDLLGSRNKANYKYTSGLFLPHRIYGSIEDLENPKGRSSDFPPDRLHPIKSPATLGLLKRLWWSSPFIILTCYSLALFHESLAQLTSACWCPWITSSQLQTFAHPACSPGRAPPLLTSVSMRLFCSCLKPVIWELQLQAIDAAWGLKPLHSCFFVLVVVVFAGHLTVLIICTSLYSQKDFKGCIEMWPHSLLLLLPVPTFFLHLSSP